MPSTVRHHSELPKVGTRGNRSAALSRFQTGESVTVPARVIIAGGKAPSA